MFRDQGGLVSYIDAESRIPAEHPLRQVRELVRREDGCRLPSSIMGFVLWATGRHQAGPAMLSIAVFLLSAVPLELQRRIINDLTERRQFSEVLWLALGYASVALTNQVLEMLLNIYRSWVAESAVRSLRRTISEAALARGLDQVG